MMNLDISEKKSNIFKHIEEMADVRYRTIDVDFSEFEDDYIKLSFEYCHNIIKHHSKTFNMASSLLDNERRNAVASLYGFCRISDDLIDKNIVHGDELLNSWTDSINCQIPNIAAPIQFAWLFTRMKYQIPAEYMNQLIKGVQMDTHKKRYETIEELVEYCYYVASTVGLMSMHIIGFSDKRAIPYAIQMGVALQLTNIISDIGEDYEMGRIYIPQEELKKYGITEDHFREKIVDDSWKKLMAFQIKRARDYYQQSWEGLSLLEAKGKWSITAAATLYQEILKMVERNKYDNLNNRAYVSKKRKLFLLAKMMIN